jgi:uridine monophosphate synthetase
MISDWTSETALKLKQLAQEHEFLIFEDRKFADIGNVVKEQYSKGRCKIADWAHIVSAHMIPGDGMIAGIKAGIPTDVTEARGIVLISQMMDSLDIAGYHEHSYAMAKRHSDMVLGFYGHQALEYDTQFVNIFDYQDKAATQKPKGHVYLVDETLVSSLFQTHELTSFLSKTLDKFRSL